MLTHYHCSFEKVKKSIWENLIYEVNQENLHTSKSINYSFFILLTYTYVLQVIGEEIQRSKNLFSIWDTYLHGYNCIDNSYSYYKSGFIPVFSFHKNQNKNKACKFANRWSGNKQCFFFYYFFIHDYHLMLTCKISATGFVEKSTILTILHGIKYSKMDQVKFFKGYLSEFHLVHCWILCPKQKMEKMGNY